MKILITGANGQLGQCLQKQLEKCNWGEYYATDYDTLDITSIVDIDNFVSKNQPDVIINCAAYTNVDKAEDDYNNAYLLNSIGPKILANIAKRYDILLIHISTDYVFGKENYNIPCTEETKGEPSGVYGITKLEGEKDIINSGCKYVILRTSWLYSEYGNNFVKTMLNLQHNKNELKVIFDQIGTPTYAHDLVMAILNICNNYYFNENIFDKFGIYNFSNEGVCSWYDFAKFIHILDGNDCNIIPCHSNEFLSKVKRPNYSVLDKTKIKETFNIEIPYWYDSLNTCIKNIHSQI